LKENAGTILVLNKRLSPLKGLVALLRAADIVVLQAVSEVKAVALAAPHADSIDLLLADSELLGSSFPSLTDTLRQARPDLQVMLFCGDIVIGSFGCTLISNPFKPGKLLEMINAILYPAEESPLTRSAASAGWQK